MSRSSVLRLAGVALLIAPVVAACGTSAFDLEVGDCLSTEDLQDAEISRVTTIDCEEPHDAEVFAAYQFPGDTYPGDQTIQDETFTFCDAEFASFVGVSYEQSELDYRILTPTEETWSSEDDREALCILESPEDVTGTLRGTNG